MMLADTTNTSKTRLNKKHAAAGRLIWIVIAVISMVTMIIGVPVYRQTLLQVCTVENAQPGDCPYAQLTPTDLQTLESNELTLEFYASTVTYSYLFSSVIAISIAAVIFWKRSDEAMALLVSITLLLSGAGEFSVSAFEIFPENLALLGDLLGFTQATLLILFLLLFPTGVFVPRWTRWIIFAFIIMAIGIFVPGLADFMQFSIIGGIIWLGSLGTAIFSQVYRYFRVSTPTTRQQTKLIVFSLAMGFLAILPFMIIRPNPGSWGFFLEIFMNSQFSSVLSIAFLISILQYRLWDINVVINRTLVYGILTALIAAIWAGSLTVIDQIISSVVGDQSKAASTVLSTLLAASIIQPARTKIETWINRRFFPEKRQLEKGFIEIEPEFWRYLDIQAVAHMTVERVCSIMGASRGAFMVRNEKGLYEPIAAHGIELEKVRSWKPDAKDMKELQRGHAAEWEESDHFSGYIPLHIPRIGPNEILGLLALSERKNGRGYSGDDLKALVQLGGKIGKALYALDQNRSDEILALLKMLVNKRPI